MLMNICNLTFKWLMLSSGIKEARNGFWLMTPRQTGIWCILSPTPFLCFRIDYFFFFFHIFLFWFKFVFHLCRSDKGRMHGFVGKVFSPSFFFSGTFCGIWLVSTATLVKTKCMFSGILNKQWQIFSFLFHIICYFGIWHHMQRD